MGLVMWIEAELFNPSHSYTVYRKLYREVYEEVILLLEDI